MFSLEDEKSHALPIEDDFLGWRGFFGISLGSPVDSFQKEPFPG